MEAVKLLKRKLALAVNEEDYTLAARIRDHPYMKLYKDLFSNRYVFASSPWRLRLHVPWRPLPLVLNPFAFV